MMRYKVTAFVFVTHIAMFLLGVLLMTLFIGQLCHALDAELSMSEQIAQDRCNRMSVIPPEMERYCYPKKGQNI